MNESALITSWAEYAATAERLLHQARNTILILDRDLGSLHLDRPTQVACLSGFLRASPRAMLRIALHNSELLRHHHPRLMELLRTFAHNFQVQELPPHLANLSDAMLIVDDQSALIRFHQDHARSKELVSDAEACKPYRKRFDDIWAEGGTSVSATTIGL